MPDAPLSDEDIIRLLQSGDRLQEKKAVEYLWKEYRGLVKNLKYVYGGEPDAVPLVLHEATVAVVLNVQQGIYDPAKSALSTYFRAIAANILLKNLRERGGGKLISLSELPPDFPKMAENETEKMMDSADVKKKMIAALERLDATCQQVLALYYFEGKSLREIAETLGMLEDAVKKRRQRCQEKVRKWLDDDFKNWYNEK